VPPPFIAFPTRFPSLQSPILSVFLKQDIKLLPLAVTVPDLELASDQIAPFTVIPPQQLLHSYSCVWRGPDMRHQRVKAVESSRAVQSLRCTSINQPAPLLLPLSAKFHGKPYSIDESIASLTSSMRLASLAWPAGDG